MGLALERSNVDGIVARAIDFDQSACQVYAANRPGVVTKVTASRCCAAKLRASTRCHPD